MVLEHGETLRPQQPLRQPLSQRLRTVNGLSALAGHYHTPQPLALFTLDNLTPFESTMRPGDPRIRQTINQISQNLESANESAQEGIYAFSHNYIGPCFSSICNYLGSCSSPCFPSRDDQLRRRRRGRSSARAEFSFGFYDDWDYDQDSSGDGILGWRHDELDRLLASSSGATGEQPRKHRRMSYGARRRSSILPNDERQDPTVIPSSSILGFLERFPWRIGSRGIRYRPSAADLQENPGKPKRDVPENEPLLEASDESDGSSDSKGTQIKHSSRKRSGTQSSQDTSNSLSSRGDLLPSDEEEDAVPLDDEFAMSLERRPTILGTEDHVFMRRSISRTGRGNNSSRETIKKQHGKGKSGIHKRRRPSRTTSKSSHSTSELEILENAMDPTIEDLKKEEEDERLQEERELDRRRSAAQRLARQRGLSVGENDRESPPPNDDSNSKSNQQPPNEASPDEAPPDPNA
ncbi:hypothetical protein FQN57_003493 [Myotisia sp. PD_48]|nr:hypothetical protein FQN57_003493 [Myotisia sp. PD_48]